MASSGGRRDAPFECDVRGSGRAAKQALQRWIRDREFAGACGQIHAEGEVSDHRWESAGGWLPMSRSI